MAVRTGRILSIDFPRGADDAPSGTTATALHRAVLYVDHNGTDLTTSDTLQWTNVPTAIQNALRNGKTVTMRDVSLHGNARNKTDGADVTLASVAISSTSITAAQKTDDYSTAADVDTTDILEPCWSILVVFSMA